jgi:transcription elongation factor GreA
LSKVLVLSIVKIKNQTNGMEMKYTWKWSRLENRKYQLLLLWERIVRKSVGDVAEITVPNGILKFEILEISRECNSKTI